MKKIDQQFIIYIRGILLIGFSLLMFKLILTGVISQFIAPKMMPFILFSSCPFFILGVVQIWRSSISTDVTCECGHDHVEKGKVRTTLIYSLFLLPIMTGFLFSNHTLDSSVAVKRGVKFSANVIGDQPAQQGSNKVKSINSKVEEYTNKVLAGDSEEVPKNVPLEHQSNISPPKIPPKGFYKLLEKKLLKQKSINVNNTDYIPVMSIIENNVDQFIGKEIEVDGFVYRENGFKDKQFVVARFGISCCVADASVYGMLSTIENASTFKTDNWVHIKGIVKKATYNQEDVPYIQIQQIESIHQPDNPYVYELYQDEQLIGPGE